MPEANEKLRRARLRVESPSSPGEPMTRHELAEAVNAHVYDALIRRADEVIRLDHTESTADSHMAASLHMLDRADALIAVWDGKPARGYGGTADVVQAAKQRGIPVTMLWPNGAERD